MRWILFRITYFIFILLLQAPPAFTQKPVKVERIGEYIPQTNTFGDFSSLCYCKIGNINQVAYVVSDLILQPEEYGLTLDPQPTCTQCYMGFKMRYIIIQLGTESACSLTLQATIGDAVTSSDPECLEPGPLLCESNYHHVVLPKGGVWKIPIPVDCGCLAMKLKYLLGIRILDVSCCGGGVPALLTDNSPTPCTNWNNRGAGWSDLAEEFPDWPGNLLIYAEALCCESPIPTENKSWGVIKKLYVK